MSRGRKSPNLNITSADLVSNFNGSVPPVVDVAEDLDDKPVTRVKKTKTAAPVVSPEVYTEETDLVDVKPVHVEKSQEKPVEKMSSEYAGMGMFEKVTLMGNLYAALSSEEVKKAVLSKPSGDKVYKVFSNAMEAEISKIMGVESPIPESSVAELMGQMFDSLNQMNQIIRLFADQRLIQLIANIYQQAGGNVANLAKQAPRQQQAQRQTHPDIPEPIGPGDPMFY
jgi:hypothetical protein